MAAALVDDGFGAVRQKGTRERVRAVRGGAFGSQNGSRQAERERDREAGRLDEVERGELLYLWSGFDAALGVCSSQGAVEDRLRRGPPRVGEEMERAVEVELLRHGQQGVVRESLITILMAEHTAWTQRSGDRVLRTRQGGGATRYEAVQALRRMVGASRIEFFVAEEVRKRPCRCKLEFGEVDGTARRHGGCTCGAGAEERMPREMVRLGSVRSETFPPELTSAERWARADAELEQHCQQIACSESTHAPGSRLPPEAQSSRADAARRAMRRLTAEHRRVIERAYGTQVHTWAGLSLEASRLAPLCPTVERARRDLVDREMLARYPGTASPAEARRTVDRGVFAADALRAKLDLVPAEDGPRARWKVERELFIREVERDAQGCLERAVRAYREARSQ